MGWRLARTLTVTVTEVVADAADLSVRSDCGRAGCARIAKRAMTAATGRAHEEMGVRMGGTSASLWYIGWQIPREYESKRAARFCDPRRPSMVSVLIPLKPSLSR